MTGSILAGTARHRLVSVNSHLDLHADADLVAVNAMITQAEQMCFVLDALESQHTVQRSTSLNVSAVDDGQGSNGSTG